MQVAENEQNGDGKARDHDHGAERMHVVDDGRGAARGGSEVVHQLSQQTAAATALIEQMRDLVGDDDEMIATAIEGETDLLEAINAAMKRLAELNALMNGIDSMMDDLKARGERFSAQRDRIRESLAVALEVANLRRFESALGTLSLKATPPKIELIDESAVPAKFWKAQEPKLDKRAVLQALKDGEAVAGATLSNGGQTIQVKFS